ncbi:hypothetical protein AB0C18_04810 [Nonomuraea muscovyensis]|uniref:hypothetical protein n=1 Tax=Nonomuraea muscovyensis TaxID=1124761 RepID=UPI0033E6F0C1
MGSIDPTAQAAHRALRALFVEGRQPTRAELEEATLPVYLGVLNAFFLNVMEAPFSGRESVEEVAGYFTSLQSRHRDLRGVDTSVMAVYTLCGIRGVPLPETFPEMGARHVDWMGMLITAVAAEDGIAGERLETYLLGSVARYSMGDF